MLGLGLGVEGPDLGLGTQGLELDTVAPSLVSSLLLTFVSEASQ